MINLEYIPLFLLGLLLVDENLIHTKLFSSFYLYIIIIFCIITFFVCVFYFNLTKNCSICIVLGIYLCLVYAKNEF